ncbi:MAG: LysR substrate-binding domain-containing protein [Nibricoccus sp.]
MELRHLRYFCAVAEMLNFSRAAERVRVAQPALSRQIRDLENELGFPLFVRSTTSVRLTDAGRNFYASAQKILGQLAIAVTGAQEVARGKSGDLNIASDWRIPMHLVPETVRKFRLRNPKVNVSFADVTIADQVEALRAGKIHLGFVPDIAIGAHEDLDMLPVYNGPIKAVLPASHPLAARESVCLRELSSERWIMVDQKPSTEFREYMIQTCRLAGFTPIFGRTTSSAQGVFSLVAAGEGVALLPELVAHEFGGVSMVLTDCPPIRLFAVWLKKATSPLVERYLVILREQIKTLAMTTKKRAKRST